jgi:hypothetical protein
MNAKGSFAAAATASRILAGGFVLLAGLATAPAHAADTVTLTAGYTISIHGVTVGRAEAKARFTHKGYAAAISGSTYGISRIVSDARAILAGSGRINGANVSPASYNLETSEGGFETHVRMAMRGSSVVDLNAVPTLVDAPDRIPITAGSRQNIVDPVGAFVVSLDHPSPTAIGPQVCNRTVHVFDGWKRFDIRLSYKETKPVTGGSDSYSGDLLVCAARYLPVAGHRSGDESVQYMADNKRLEISMAPIAGTSVYVPYRIVIGTRIGDLVIAARQFSADAGEQQARAN